MISTEFAEVIPDRFNNPHAPNFINESCHSSYNNTAYYSGSGSCTHSFDTGSTHHSLILEYPATGQNQLLEDHKDSSRTSYSCEQNIQVGSSCIQLLVKEASSIFPGGSVEISGAHTNGDHMAGNEDKGMGDSMGGVQVRIQYADEEVDTTQAKLSKIQRLSQDMLRPSPCPTTSPPSSCSTGSGDSIGSPTPTPSYGGLTSSTTEGYPGSEEKAFAVRGSEVAQLRDQPEEREEPLCDQTSKDEETRLQDTDELHIKSPRPVPTRRSHLSHLQSPHIHLPIPPSEARKLSDPAVHVRRQKLKTNFEPRRQRCLSDSEAPSFPFILGDDDELKSEEGCYSALGCDSGFHDERMSRYQDNMNPYSSPRVSLYSSDVYSQEDGSELTAAQQRMRRTTPHPFVIPFSQDSDDQSSGVATSSNPGTMVHPRERSRRSLMKHFSQGSIGGVSVGGGSIGGASSVGASSESPSVSSVLETQSNLTCATDILSSLGFDDFDSPQLVPDRFIPRELEYLKPSSMKAAFIEQVLSPDPPRSPDSLTSGHSSTQAVFVPQRSVEISDLPLGATAENFLPGNIRSGSPVNNASSATLSENNTLTVPPSPSESTPLFTDTAAMAGFTRSRILETVPEETASDLSPSPRWLSPRVSIDHSVLDLAEGKLGASLVKVRRRSLPTREGYRWSIGSLVESDTGGDSIHLSVTSYDDELAAERERRENLLPGMTDDIMVGAGRRRRRGVYTPPQTLLSWLSTQKTIDEEAVTDPDELPWPFNEQAHLRKSLTEISLAQQRVLSDNATHAGSVSQADSDDGNMLESSAPDLSLSPASTPNIRLSPQPTLSDIDEDLEPNNLEVETQNTGEQSNHYQSEISSDLSLHDSQLNPPVFSPHHATKSSLSADGEGGSADPDSEAALRSTFSPHHHPHQYHHLIPISTSPRHRKQVVSPFSLRRKVLPNFFNEPMPSNTLFSSIGEEQDLGPIDSAEDLTMVPPADGLVTLSSSDDSIKDPSTGDSSATTSSASVCSESPARLSRRPRLDTLRQDSNDSIPEGLLQDVHEVELSAGIIHSPMMSSRRSRTPVSTSSISETPASPSRQPCSGMLRKKSSDSLPDIILPADIPGDIRSPVMSSRRSRAPFSNATTSSVSETPARPNRQPCLGTLRKNSSDSLPDTLPMNMSEIALLTGDVQLPVMSSRRSRAPLTSATNSSRPESPARPNRRPRLDMLKQNSSDSLSDGLPEDMSEIELLTGDIHSPVMSSRRSRAPFKKQKSMEESYQSGSPVTVGAVTTGQSRPSRRVAVIGEAPSSSDLFANTTIAQNQSEYGKYMVL